MKSFKLIVYEAERIFYEGDCESVILPTMVGQYGILAHHRNAILAIVPGKMTFRIPGGENQEAAISKGLVKIEDGNVLVLVNTCELPEEIDANRAERAEEEARRLLKEKSSAQEYYLAQMELVRAINRLNIKRAKK